jgi:hypothetical protein
MTSPAHPHPSGRRWIERGAGESGRSTSRVALAHDVRSVCQNLGFFDGQERERTARKAHIVTRRFCPRPLVDGMSTKPVGAEPRARPYHST